MFEYPYEASANFYTLYIFEDNNEEFQQQNYIVKKQTVFPIVLIKNLTLGKKYKWFVVTNLKGGKNVKSEWHYFSVLNTSMNNAKLYAKVQHYKKNNKIEDGIVWCDQYRCAVDRNGDIIWFVADEQKEIINAKVVRDFKLYNNGNISFINQPAAKIVDINLNTVWDAPMKGTIAEAENEDYHHDFEKLSNGHYMILGNEKVKFSYETSNDTALSAAVNFCNIIEFDSLGKIVWFWRMKDHFPYDILVNSKMETENGIADPHANSFTCNEKQGFIYLSFRDISRIIKINKQTKEIVASYGLKLNDDDTIYETDLFRLQHDIQLLDNGDMLIFNNNDINKGKVSNIEIVHLNEGQSDSTFLKWKFDLNYDKHSDGKIKRMGGVKILPNGNYLICEGSSNRVVEINKKKEILWDFALKQLDTTGKVNDKFALYRANFSYSLYPYYFKITNTNANDLIIFNAGYFSDSYIIEVMDKKNNTYKTIHSPKVKANSKLLVKLHLKEDENFEIKVKSLNSNITK